MLALQLMLRPSSWTFSTVIRRLGTAERMEYRTRQPSASTLLVSFTSLLHMWKWTPDPRDVARNVEPCDICETKHLAALLLACTMLNA